MGKCKLCNRDLNNWIKVRDNKTKRLTGYFCNEKHATQYIELKEGILREQGKA